MFKKELKSHLPLTLIWLLIVILLRWQWHLNLIWLALGALLGTFLLDLDHWLYLLVINSQELTSMRVRRFLEQRNFKEALMMVMDTKNERVKLSFHNALFQVIFYPFCFFVLTSTGSLFGAGLVMAVALSLLKEEITCLLTGKEEFLRQRLFWPFGFQISLQNQQFFVITMALLFLGLNLLLI